MCNIRATFLFNGRNACACKEMRPQWPNAGIPRDTQQRTTFLSAGCGTLFAAWFCGAAPEVPLSDVPRRRSATSCSGRVAKATSEDVALSCEITSRGATYTPRRGIRVEESGPGQDRYARDARFRGARGLKGVGPPTLLLARSTTSQEKTTVSCSSLPSASPCWPAVTRSTTTANLVAAMLRAPWNGGIGGGPPAQQRPPGLRGHALAGMVRLCSSCRRRGCARSGRKSGSADAVFSSAVVRVLPRCSCAELRRRRKKVSPPRKDQAPKQNTRQKVQ